jgi:hypothetical protein
MADPRVRLGKLGPVGIGTEVDVMAIDANKNATSYQLVVRNFSQGPVLVNGTPIPGTLVRLALTAFDGQHPLPIRDKNHQVGFVCVDAVTAEEMGYSFPCELHELQFNSKIRKWEIRVGIPPQRIADVRHTPHDHSRRLRQRVPSKHNRNSKNSKNIADIRHISRDPSGRRMSLTVPSKHGSVVPERFVGDTDIVKLTFGGKTASLSRRTLLHQMRRGRVAFMSDQQFCNISSLNVWLISSDAKRLRTLSFATLIPIGPSTPRLVRIFSTEFGRDRLDDRTRALQNVRAALMVKLVTPDGVTITIPRNEIRDGLHKKTKVVADGHTFHFLKLLHGYISLEAVGEIEASKLHTFPLSDIANGYFAGRHVARTSKGYVDAKKPQYTLAPGWLKLVPPIELMYEKVLTAGTYMPTRDAVRAALQQVGTKIPDGPTMRGLLEKMGKMSPTEQQWRQMTTVAVNLSAAAAKSQYEDYLWELVPVFSWIAVLADVC